MYTFFSWHTVVIDLLQVKVLSKCPPLLEISFSSKQLPEADLIAGALLKITSASIQLLQVESLEQMAKLGKLLAPVLFITTGVS